MLRQQSQRPISVLMLLQRMVAPSRLGQVIAPQLHHLLQDMASPAMSRLRLGQAQALLLDQLTQAENLLDMAATVLHGALHHLARAA